MEGSLSPRLNKLLGQLPDTAYARVRPHLTFVEYPPGDCLVEEARNTRYLHFPVTGLIARMIRDSSGKGNEFGLCGNEGAIGLSGLSGKGPIRALSTSLVIVSAGCYRVAAPVIDRELEDAELRGMIIRYFRYVLSEAMLTSFCNKHHTLEQQLCRVLLLMTDRVSASDIKTTHQRLADILGARREGITEIIGRLRKEKILSLNRGTLSITDRRTLISCSCDCYRRMHERYKSLLTSVGHA